MFANLRNALRKYDIFDVKRRLEISEQDRIEAERSLQESVVEITEKLKLNGKNVSRKSGDSGGVNSPGSVRGVDSQE